MSGGYTVTPEIAENPDGTEYIADFSVSTHNYSPTDPENFYQTDANGERVFDEEALDQLEGYVEENDYDPEQEYIDTLYSAFPSASDALAWAADNYPEDVVHEYNAALENSDWDFVVPFLEEITSRYEELTPEELQAEEQTEEQTDEDWSEEEQYQAAEATQFLVEAEPDYELADQYLDLVEEAQAHGDEVLAAVAAATSAFHSEEVTADEAIQYIIENYPKQEVIRVFNLLNGG
jgi:hypothetical protein